MKRETKNLVRKIGIVLFLFYIVLLIYFLFFSEGYGRLGYAEREYSYNFHLFQEIRRFWVYRDQLGTFAVVTNLLGNVVGFVPFGFILPVIFNNARNGLLIVISGFTLSLCVETIQLVTKVGSFDVDDLLLNTLGAFIGYLLFWICNTIRRKYHGKKV